MTFVWAEYQISFGRVTAFFWMNARLHFSERRLSFRKTPNFILQNDGFLLENYRISLGKKMAFVWQNDRVRLVE